MIMKLSEVVKNFLPQFSENIESMSRETMPVDRSMNFTDNDDLERVIFAPSPLTGFPDNGLSVLVDKCASQEIKEYIQKYLAENPSVSSPSSIEEGFNTITNRYMQYGSELESVAEQLRSQILPSDD